MNHLLKHPKKFLSPSVDLYAEEIFSGFHHPSPSLPASLYPASSSNCVASHSDTRMLNLKGWMATALLLLCHLSSSEIEDLMKKKVSRLDGAHLEFLRGVTNPLGIKNLDEKKEKEELSRRGSKEMCALLRSLETVN
ncbi:unnamed protein product [Microthlaspi erraticum]|uniref:Uncharacterized protein n=1 Tax=Microthlaspi erraticum TaxID=1685480 RepID=A0A6D2J2C7_9BRAS|nr:unnamed protein product [Microthlaspi erraticum]